VCSSDLFLMSRYQHFQVTDPEGVQSTLLQTSRFLDGGAEKIIRTADGQEVLVRNDLLELLDDNSYRLKTPLRTLLPEATPDASRPVGSAGTGRTMDAGESLVIPAVEERLSVAREKVETGRIRLQKHVEESTAVVDEPLVQEGFRVERIPINRVLPDGSVPEPRHEGDVLVLPVLEEVLVVEKRVVLKEEIRITPERRETREPQTHTLRREHIDVERLS